MDNPARTARYLALLNERRSELHAQLARILPARARFVWEIGCGHGHFLTSYAQTHPDKICLGIDLASDRIERAIRKRDRARLSNLHFVRAEARTFLEAMPVDAILSDIFVLFPDPWPKLRHHKHRLMQLDFLDALAHRAGENARIFFRTDYQPYFENVRGILGGRPDWLLVEEPWPFERETVFQSRATRYYSLIAMPRHAATIS